MEGLKIEKEGRLLLTRLLMPLYCICTHCRQAKVLSETRYHISDGNDPIDFGHPVFAYHMASY